MSGSLDAFRSEVRAFLADRWDPDRFASELTLATTAAGTPLGAWHTTLQEGRLVAPHWPERHGGRGLGIEARLVVTEELIRIGAPAASNTIAVGWAGPTILDHGTEDQKQRFLLPMLTGEEQWCQLFSEPGAGSDLAGLTTRAERDGDEFVVNGQKIWTSGAQDSAWGILLARTDPSAAKHEGITYLLLDMRQPGVEVRRIRQMTGEAEFCEVFLTDARVPADLVVGEVHGGWPVALTTLAHERISLSTGHGMLWGLGPTFAEFWAWAANRPRDGITRDRLAAAYVAQFVIGRLKQRTVASLQDGGVPGIEAAIQKIVADRAGQEAMLLAHDLMGAGGLAGAPNPGERKLQTAFLFSRALTIGGGTEEVQKDILGERALGLPKG